MNRIVVFSGPSLCENESQFNGLKTTWQPPVQSGSLYKCQLRKGDVVLMLDGYYGNVPAIKHQEIIEFINEGVLIYGAASLGALRAAELHTVGMIGLGYVFNQYMVGLIDGDDEVAVLHDPIDFTSHSVPLVNVRFAIQNLMLKQLICLDEAQWLISELKRRPFWERTGTLIFDLLRSRFTLQKADELYEWIQSPSFNVKKRDAVLALTQLQRAHTDQISFEVNFFRKSLNIKFKKELNYEQHQN